MTVITIHGKFVIDIYESFDGSYWFVTEKAWKQDSVIGGKLYEDDQILFGYVRLSSCPDCAEFGYFSESELNRLGPRVWKVHKQDWSVCPMVEVQDVPTEEADGDGDSTRRPLRSEAYGDDIVRRFTKSSDALVGGCRATYTPVMNDAIDNVLGELERLALNRLVAGRSQGAGAIRCDTGESDIPPSPAYSNTCKEVNDKMEFNMQSKMDEYLGLLGQIKQKTTDERTAVSILQEISRDRRSAEIREERGTKSTGPATEKQKQFMKKLNIQFPANVTKQEASTLIDEELAKNGE